MALMDDAIRWQKNDAYVKIAGEAAASAVAAAVVLS